MALRRIVVTHTSSYVFDTDALDKAWRDGPAMPNYLARGTEDEDLDDRAATMFEAYSDSLVELFHPLQDDDQSYEIEDYDPDA